MPPEQKVGGSNPLGRTNFLLDNAQLSHAGGTNVALAGTATDGTKLNRVPAPIPPVALPDRLHHSKFAPVRLIGSILE